MTRSVASVPKAAKVSQAAKVPCADVVTLPDNIFDPAQPGGVPKMVGRIASYWGKDRKALGDCAAKNRTLGKAADAQEGQGR